MNRSVALFYALLLAIATHGQEQKILTVTVNQKGIITLGRDIIKAGQLAQALQERLFSSYKGTDRMHDRIVYIRYNNVADSIHKSVVQEIRSGQQRALNNYCIDRYRKRFDELDEKRKQQVMDDLPVLFQTEYELPDDPAYTEPDR